MNRQQRRAAGKSDRNEPPTPQNVSTSGNGQPQEKPGIMLRIAASVLLTPWVINRVNSPDVERMLANMAIQAGKPEVAKNLLNRIAMRKDKPR